MSDGTPGDEHDLFDLAPCGLIVTTADDIVTVVNSTFLEWTGYERHEVVGRDFHALLDPGSQAFYATRYQADLWGREDMKEIAFRLLRADGSEMPILVNAALSKSDTRARSTVRLAIFDSTARHDYEKQMLTAKRQAETSEQSVRVLQDASAMFLAAMSERDLAVALAATAREAFAAADVAVILYDDGEIRAAEGEHLMPMLTALNDALPELGTALSRAELVAIRNLDDAYRRSRIAGDLMRGVRAEAITAVPISDGEHVLGALVCLFGRQRSFDQNSIDLKHALARQAGLVLSRVALQEALERLAMRDHLTGLANRNLLDERISHALAVARRTRQPIALLFADLDGFKRINDELGHRAGDMVLQVISERMVASVRDTDVVGRFGGDEFLVVCESTDAESAMHVAERLAAEIRERVDGLPEGFPVSASLGVAVYSPDLSPEVSSDSLVLQADAAMYVSKRAGGDRATLAPPQRLLA
jgi:diguanylate cyclase (GGDEF)-like protein/PAS domain S-box-containing protein